VNLETHVRIGRLDAGSRRRWAWFVDFAGKATPVVPSADPPGFHHSPVVGIAAKLFRGADGAPLNETAAAAIARDWLDVLGASAQAGDAGRFRPSTVELATFGAAPPGVDADPALVIPLLGIPAGATDTAGPGARLALSLADAATGRIVQKRIASFESPWHDTDEWRNGAVVRMTPACNGSAIAIVPTLRDDGYVPLEMLFCFSFVNRAGAGWGFFIIKN
jgi:hypothetical protein